VKTRRDGHTADRILDVAERLVQTRGFNAFSYADVSQALGMRKASLHHHFSTKSQLGLALLTRYRLGFGDALRSIDAGASGAGECLARYVELYASVLRRNRMCLCGMLAADVATLPRPMRESVARFFAENEAWLARTLDRGRKDGELRFEGAPASMAEFFVSSLEGAMLLARGSGKAEHFEAVARHLLAGVQAASGKRRALSAGFGMIKIKPRRGREAPRSLPDFDPASLVVSRQRRAGSRSTGIRQR
jgi:TetR/AcrR family transcriptional repressor of nem operon